MKVRNGFVSNSSSSSFVIANTNYSIDEVKKYCVEYCCKTVWDRQSGT